MNFLIVGLVIFAFTRLVTWLVIHFTADSIILNQSALFGLANSGWGVAGVILVGLFLLIRSLASSGGRFGLWGVALIVVGALSNILDRLLYGGVADYLHLSSWSTFNLADIEIVLGAVLLTIKSKDPLVRR